MCQNQLHLGIVSGLSAVRCRQFDLQALYDIDKSDDSIPKLASLTYCSHLLHVIVTYCRIILFGTMF